MKIINVIEHQGELYRIGDEITVTFDNGGIASGEILNIGEYCFYDNDIQEAIVFGNDKIPYCIPLDEIIEMHKENIKEQELL